jgi:hypothetical protein
MDEYLTKLRQKPDHHKKYFAFGVSGCFTALMFLIWTFANFGGAATVVAKNVPDEEVRAVSPFENIGESVASAWIAIKKQVGNTSDTIEKTNLDGKYKEIRNDALNNQYGE